MTATSAPGLTRQHVYDVAGRLLSVTEPTNATANVAYTYDELGRVLSETSRGLTHSYAYDIAGNRTQASYGTGRVVATTYDNFNRPLTINEGGRSTSYGYDLGGRAVILKAGNGQTSRNSYDALGRLKQRTLFRTEAMTAGDELTQFAWTHDLLGNVMSQSETWPGEVTRPGTRTTSMAYDANNRLTNETIDDPTAGVTSTAYAYDNANNRTTKQVTGGTEPGLWSYVYNAANQLTSWQKSLNGSPAKTAALTYDAAGNRIAQTIQDQASGIQTTSYAWDAQDRLSSVTMPDGSQHAYKYDYRTRRIATTRSGGTLASMATAILFAGGLSLAEWEVAGSVPAMANTPTVEYTRGPDMGGGVGGMLYSLRGGTTKYSLSNGRGDIVAQADQGANLTWTASYEAYGKRTKETGTNQDKQRANSKDEDPTGLLNEGFRYRDIETGVWLSRDPAGFVDGPNLYAYVQQNPWTSFDPDGLEKAKPATPTSKSAEDFAKWQNEQKALKAKQNSPSEITESARKRIANQQVKPGLNIADYATEEERQKIVTDIDRVYSTVPGNHLVEYLKNSGASVVIAPMAKDQQDSMEGMSTLAVNGREVIYMNLRNEKAFPSDHRVGTLAEEFQHCAERVATGNAVKAGVDPASPRVRDPAGIGVYSSADSNSQYHPPNSKPALQAMEFRGARARNLVQKALGLPTDPKASVQQRGAPTASSWPLPEHQK